jgi:alpha-L-arabinofuranosidase
VIEASLVLQSGAPCAGIDDRLYSSFVEHVGRSVYGGIFEPRHPSADPSGFRRDVLELAKELRLGLVRYPGGNFVSSYDWEDGVGPVGDRPRRLDLTWHFVEPNLIGIGEFNEWCLKAGARVMPAINLGTRGMDDARNFIEYCNHPGGSYWSELRRSHGREAPYGFKVWCLGNEMDGKWEIGQKTAREYGVLAHQVSKALKAVDESVETVVCGSSHNRMPSFPDWDAAVLEECYDDVDYLSLHFYLSNAADDLPEFLAQSEGMESFIKTVAHTADYVQVKIRSKKRMKLSFDEWNVWYHSKLSETAPTTWTVAPPRLEDVYTFEDAIAVGSCLITLLKNADRVRIACLAQLVNAIAPIMTSAEGPAWRQTIYYPFMHASRYGRGVVLRSLARSPTYKSKRQGEIAFLHCVATQDRDSGIVTLFCVNRSPDQELLLRCSLGGFGHCSILEHLILADKDIKASNTMEAPERVLPRSIVGEAKLDGEDLTVLLPALSWNVLRVKTSDAHDG